MGMRCNERKPFSPGIAGDYAQFELGVAEAGGQVTFSLDYSSRKTAVKEAFAYGEHSRSVVGSSTPTSGALISLASGASNRWSETCSDATLGGGLGRS